MPAPTPSLTIGDVHRFVRQRCLAPPGSGSGRVGVEIEWLVFDAEDPGRALSLASLEAGLGAAGVLAGGGRTSLEPGGQVELSSAPLHGIGKACLACEVDLAALRQGLAHGGMTLVGMGLDPTRPHRQVVASPRYTAMATYFDAQGDAGRAMMCATASIQVNLDLVDEPAAAERWHRSHLLGPTLAAAFANSPFAGGRPSGWRSSRLATWAVIDAGRTTPVLDGRGARGGRGGCHPAEGWARYALDADVMLVRAPGDRFLPLGAALPFRRWMSQGHELGYPTEDDLDYHLTTLFPPVRPRGWLELRMIDALPDPWWRVATAVTAALVDDPEAAEGATAAAAGTSTLWDGAARHGLSHPALARSARGCFTAAMAALPRLGADAETEAACAAYADRYVERGRCPADDLLDAWAAEPNVLPIPPQEAPPWT
ncbi:MAG: ergothioneine biosynthesis glutamate--cysteine ligase EgtA [Acidimicrobiales bacterium]